MASEEQELTAMPRHIIVDGYNLGWRLAAASGVVKNDSASVRHAVIQRLSTLAGFIAEEITVVFDGPVANALSPSPEEQNANLKVIFSGPDRSADTVIEKMAFSAKNPSDILVVTSDRLERTAAAGSGAQTVGAGAFLEMLAEYEKQLAATLARKKAARPFRATLADAFPPDFKPGPPKH